MLQSQTPNVVRNPTASSKARLYVFSEFTSVYADELFEELIFYVYSTS